MTGYRKLVAALLGAVGASLASGGDLRVVVASVLTAFAVWLVPNTEPGPFD